MMYRFIVVVCGKVKMIAEMGNLGAIEEIATHYDPFLKTTGSSIANYVMTYKGSTVAVYVWEKGTFGYDDVMLERIGEDCQMLKQFA